MATFVLVHGAWQTAGTWDRVRPILEARGHMVLAPDWGPVEEGATLRQHIDKVGCALVEAAAREAVLVGHSYAGMIISGVANVMPHRIGRLVYVDAFVPEDGEAVVDLLPESVVAMFRQVAEEKGGWRLPGGEGQLDMWGLKEGEAREFVKARLCDFSLRCFEEKIALPAGDGDALPRSYVASVAEDYPARPFFAPFAQKAREAGWPVVEIEAGHDPQAEAPEELTDAIVGQAR